MKTVWWLLAACLVWSGGCASTESMIKPIPPEAEPDTHAHLDSLPSDPRLQAFKVKDGFAEYLLGPGDILGLTLRDVDLLREVVTVRPDGNISFSLVENIRAGGRTATELDSALTAELGRYLRAPKVDVEVQEYHSKIVSVLGALQSVITSGTKTGQGRYALKARTTVLDIILEAGGTTPDAQLDQVLLIRGDKSYRLNLQRVLNTGDQRDNVILQGGDIVIVPGTDQLSKKVAVLGEVQTPNVYMFSAEAQLLEALSRAGGLNGSALRDDIRVIRRVDEQPRMFTVNFSRLTEHADLSQNITLLNNDIIYVPRSFIGDVNDAIAKVEPLLDLLLLPAAFRDLYTTGGGLRIDTGRSPEEGTGTLLTLPAGKAVAGPEPEAEKDEEEE